MNNKQQRGYYIKKLTATPYYFTSKDFFDVINFYNKITGKNLYFMFVTSDNQNEQWVIKDGNSYLQLVDIHNHVYNSCVTAAPSYFINRNVGIVDLLKNPEYKEFLLKLLKAI